MTPTFTRRRLIGAGAAASALALAPACTANRPAAAPSLPDRLRQRHEVVIAMDPSTLKPPFDPVLGFAETGVALIHSTLTTANERNEIVNDLATGYQVSPDGLTWTFTIRPDATFSDGSTLTASDVAFTYNKAKESAKVSLPGFSTAVARDATTVELRMEKPSSTLLYTTAVLGIVPQGGYHDGYGTRPVGSGPWKLVDYLQGQQLILERNDSYYGPKPVFAKATLLLMESDAALAAAQSGKVDLACVYPALSRQQVPGFSLTSLPTFGYRCISLPCQAPGAWQVDGQQVGNAFTSDPVVRRAMALGVNRQQVIEQCLLGYGEVAYDICDAFDWGIKEKTAQLKDGDVEQARQLLEQGGWLVGQGGVRAKGGTPARFTVLYPPNDSGRQAIAEAFKAQMLPLGIDVQLTGTDFTSMVSRNRKDAVVLGGGRLSPYHEFTMLSQTTARTKGWLNIACHTDPVVEAHLEQALAAPDQKTAQEEWRRALWDGKTGGSLLGSAPYLTMAYIRHNYFVRDGLDIGAQHTHPHDHFLHVIHNLNRWTVRG